MNKIIGLIISITVSVASLIVPAFASASCAASYPTIGTIQSASTSGSVTTFTLANVWLFNATNFPTNSTSIDAYNAVVSAYVQNQFTVPEASQYNATNVPSGYSSWQSYAQQNANTVSVSASALGTFSWHTGDIVVVGPPASGACQQNGFVGFYTPSGAIEGAIAQDPQYAPYTYGSDTLSLATSTASDCATDSSGDTTCTVGIEYTVGATTTLVSPGGSADFSPSGFGTVSLITSTYTTLPSGQSASDWSPIQMLHTITFPTTTSSTIRSQIMALEAQVQQLLSVLAALKGVVASRAGSSSCAFGSRTLALGSTGNSVVILQNYLIGKGYLSAGSNTGYYGTLTMQAVERLQVALGVASGGTDPGYGVFGPRTRAALGCSVGPYPPAASSGALSVAPSSGNAPLAVTFTATNLSASSTYFIDFGDGSKGDVSTDGTASHTYASAGAYTALLMSRTPGVSCTGISYDPNNPLSFLHLAGNCTPGFGASIAATTSISVSSAPSAQSSQSAVQTTSPTWGVTYDNSNVGNVSGGGGEGGSSGGDTGGGDSGGGANSSGDAGGGNGTW